MYWTFELAQYLDNDNVPWPATKKQLLDYCHRSGVPIDVIENLNELEDDDEILYHSIADIWHDQPDKSEYYYGNEEDEDSW